MNFEISVGSLKFPVISAKNRRSAINKIIESPDSVAIVQTYSTSATLFRVWPDGRTESIGSIRRVEE